MLELYRKRELCESQGFAFIRTHVLVQVESAASKETWRYVRSV